MAQPATLSVSIRHDIEVSIQSRRTSAALPLGEAETVILVLVALCPVWAFAHFRQTITDIVVIVLGLSLGVLLWLAMSRTLNELTVRALVGSSAVVALLWWYLHPGLPPAYWSFVRVAANPRRPPRWLFCQPPPSYTTSWDVTLGFAASFVLTLSVFAQSLTAMVLHYRGRVPRWLQSWEEPRSWFLLAYLAGAAVIFLSQVLVRFTAH